ncbi:Uncharacterised protein [Vibrio cholerae]|nr:Uncharacterised protein [Vibrio cholerae]
MSVTANNFATRYGSGDQEGAGFDTIGNHSMLTTAKTFYALNGNAVRAGTRDFRTQFIEEHSRIHNLWFTRRVIQYGSAFC